MRFTENEMTKALEGAAKMVMSTQREVRKSGRDVEDVWRETGRFQRYQLLDSLAGQVLPVLTALPDVEVEPGTRPTFSDAEVEAAVEQQLGEEGGRLRRAVVHKTRVALVRAALAALPVRQDPDALIVPDHL